MPSLLEFGQPRGAWVTTATSGNWPRRLGVNRARLDNRLAPATSIVLLGTWLNLANGLRLRLDRLVLRRVQLYGGLWRRGQFVGEALHGERQPQRVRWFGADWEHRGLGSLSLNLCLYITVHIRNNIEPITKQTFT